MKLKKVKITQIKLINNKLDMKNLLSMETPITKLTASITHCIIVAINNVPRTLLFLNQK